MPIPFWFELLAATTGAISGAMSASRARYDIFGTVVLALIVGLLGGVIRDVLLQDYGIYAFQRPEFIVVCALTGLAVFYFGRLVVYLNRAIEVLDTISLGMWAILSVGKALSAGLGIVGAIVVGTIASVGGGIVRDTLMNRTITAFQPGSLYGSAALIGTSVFALLSSFGLLGDFAAPLCMLLIILIRLSSLIFGISTKPSRDLSAPLVDAMADPIGKLFKRRKA